MMSVPKMRFKGFNDEWQRKKLCTLVERVTRKNRGLESTLPLTISSQYGLINQTNFFNKQIASSKLENYFLLKKGEFAYNKSYSKEAPWGAIKRLNDYDNGVLSTLYILFKPISTNSDFLQSFFNSSKWHQNVSQIATEGARNHGLLNISPIDFFNIEMKVPYLLEQQQIGAFFSKLDALISAQSKKVTLLKQLKHGYLQRMFPQEDQTIPQVRFKDNNNYYPEWKIHKLNEFIIEYKQKTTENNQYPVLTSSRKGIYLQSNYFNGHNVASKDNTGYNIVPKNYFTYRHMSDDLVFTFNINTIIDKGIVSTLYPVFTTTNQMNRVFLYYDLNNGNEFKRYAIKQRQGGSRTYMYFSKLKEMNIRVPSLSEQQKIGSLFAKLDHLIELQNHKLALLQQLKKCYLQKMFC